MGDNTKKNDVFSFVVIANHDKTENICEYIASVAPHDITAALTRIDSENCGSRFGEAVVFGFMKRVVCASRLDIQISATELRCKNTNQVPLGLVQYLTCPQPITFSVSFVIDRKSALLRDYLSVESMIGFIPEACEFVESLRKNSPDSPLMTAALTRIDSENCGSRFGEAVVFGLMKRVVGASRLDIQISATELRCNPVYFDDILTRLRAFKIDLARKQVNEKLSRQIHLASAFAAMVFHLVSLSTQAGYLRWISDRDTLIERHDSIVYDLSYLYFILLSSKQHMTWCPIPKGS